MANFTKKSEHNVEFAKGGKTHMFGEQAADPQKPATTSPTESPAPGAKFASGGSHKMFGYAGSQPAEAGKTSAR
jgi:hypothetical protein